MNKYLVSLLILISSEFIFAYNSKVCESRDSSLDAFGDILPLANFWAGGCSDVSTAPCRKRNVPSVEEMTSYINGKKNWNKVAKDLFGIQIFDDPQLIDFLIKSIPESEENRVAVYEKIKFCKSVTCVFESLYEKSVATKILYLNSKYRINTVHYSEKGAINWESDFLNDVILTFQDLPQNIHPIQEDLKILRFKKSEVDSNNAAETTKPIIKIFDSMKEYEPEQRQMLVLHELGHAIGDQTKLDVSSEWKGIYATNEKKTSLYGEKNMREDFSESIVSYRYTGAEMKVNNPKRYNFIKEKVFNNVEYNFEANCKDK